MGPSQTTDPNHQWDPPQPLTQIMNGTISRITSACWLGRIVPNLGPRCMSVRGAWSIELSAGLWVSWMVSRKQHWVGRHDLDHSNGPTLSALSTLSTHGSHTACIPTSYYSHASPLLPLTPASCCTHPPPYICPSFTCLVSPHTLILPGYPFSTLASYHFLSTAIFTTSSKQSSVHHETWHPESNLRSLAGFLLRWLHRTTRGLVVHKGPPNPPHPPLHPPSPPHPLHASNLPLSLLIFRRPHVNVAGMLLKGRGQGSGTGKIQSRNVVRSFPSSFGPENKN